MLNRPASTVALLLGALIVAAPLGVAAPASAADTDIRINEIESDQGRPGDWIELYNAGAASVDISGWVVKDDNDTRTSALPQGTVVSAGGFFVIDESTLGYGLGSGDAARIFLPDGTTLIDGFTWAGLGHAPATYGRNPDGTGQFGTTSAPTKGAANTFTAPVPDPPAMTPLVVINEIESEGTASVDWIELGNTGMSTLDVSGYILRDDNPNNGPLVLPPGSTIESGGYLAIDTQPAFGLGGADAARLFAPDDATLIDLYAWSVHAATTYGRCPDLTGPMTVTAAPTKGLRNDCAVTPVPTPAPAMTWPGASDVATVDRGATFSADLSGLAYEARPAGDILWAVENGSGLLYRLIFDGLSWIPDAGDWADGLRLRYPDGTGTVDSEGVALTDAGSAGGVYVSSERDNDAENVSRPSVLRYDVSDTTGDLVATREWNLAADLPVLRPNFGLEGVAWIPDADLVGAGLVDESTGAAYSPARYPGHGGGLFFVGVEEDGNVYGFALNDDGTFARVITFASGFSAVAELEYDSSTKSLLVVCDEVCDGRISAFAISTGSFAATATYERPAGMANLANEGFALAASCVNGSRAAYWADDGDTDGFSLRAGTFACAASGDPITPAASATGARQLAETGTDATPVLVIAIAIAMMVLGLGAIGAQRRRMPTQ